ncbi:carotenoid oxygenase family protein [Rhizorhapis suberifaciens]|uniref:Dioxygenase n=1 Tax=Rhizorhapis suberifaciens TaxID=13656 RepID=A0A840HSM2_9SPHN|nr:carotenoid oxygenase family protein [Rhizorhapis suberifaciens]MBB4640995.1 carotenoid cleavage dioxygenase [Rhizorhapis suberifaciens]
MKIFPQTPDFMGLNEPLGVEVHLENLEVEGTIPSEIEGAFFRAVPDPEFAPLYPDDTALSGDGMISRIRFQGGKVDYDIRYVKTARYLAEKEAGKALFGRYRNPYTDRAEVQGVDRTVANTTPIWHAGRLFMTKEDGRAYEVNPNNLETLGSWDYHGALKSETMTAHVRIDPETGEMFFFGYEAGGLCSTDVAYCIADRDGTLVSEQWFKAPYCSMMHDFAITESFAIFPVFPTTASLDRVKEGGAHWIHEPELESWVGIMPRYGKVEEMRWFKGPKGVSVYHIMNAFEEGGKVHMDMHLSDTNAFAFIRVASGIDRQPWEIQGGFVRWTFDMESGDNAIGQEMKGPPGDMPRIPDAKQGRPYGYGWYGSVNPQGGPPLLGGPAGVCFNMLFRIEPDTGRLEALGLPPGHAIHEPVHVPAADPAHEGWLIAIVDHQTGDTQFEHAAWILEAGNIGAGPVAKVRIPTRLRAQVHGWWVSSAQLAQAKAR